jgi:hypothetical protein
MEWKQVIGFEGLYIVSENGNVLSLGNGCSTNTLTKNERHLTQRLSRNGYLNVKLSKQGERTYISVHRLVALSFIPNPEKKPQVNHKDGNKGNNHISNLEWATARENIRHSVDNGLQVMPKGIDNPCSKQIRQLSISNELIREWGSINEVKRIMGFNSFGIIKCCKKEKKYNTAYGYKWQYV